MGGLGNQMFQYALGRTLAMEHDTKLLIDLSHLENQPENETPREYELDCFSVNAKFTHKPAPTEEQLRKLLLKKLSFKIFFEKGFPFNKEVLNLPDQTLLIGYWQSEKYFKEYAKQIRSEFIFTKPLSDAKQKMLEEILACPTSVSFQIRRGDYVSNPNSKKFHGLTSMTYYDKAVRHIEKNVKKPVFYVISDDPKWCEKNIKLNHQTIFLNHVPGTGWEDMYLMSQCKHNIIANSSFGWWGSWLNKNPEKIVIAPKTWAQEKSADYTDVALDSWVRF